MPPASKKSPRPHISAVELTTVATGIGGIVANKGALVAKFDYRGDTLAFVCSHLEAHEGHHHCERRNEMAAEIMRQARVGNRDADLGSQFHHVFWAGDLNYRLVDPVTSLVTLEGREGNPL